jgi:hypothetical protein
MGEDLIVEIEVFFTLDQNRPGSSIEIVCRGDKAHVQGLVKPEKRGGRHRDVHLSQQVEKPGKHTD